MLFDDDDEWQTCSWIDNSRATSGTCGDTVAYTCQATLNMFYSGVETKEVRESSIMVYIRSKWFSSEHEDHVLCFPPDLIICALGLGRIPCMNFLPADKG